MVTRRLPKLHCSPCANLHGIGQEEIVRHVLGIEKSRNESSVYRVLHVPVIVTIPVCILSRNLGNSYWHLVFNESMIYSGLGEIILAWKILES